MQQETAPDFSVPGQTGLSPRPGAAGRAAVTFLLCAVLFTVTLVAVGFVMRLLSDRYSASNLAVLGPLLTAGVLFTGLLLIARSRVPELRALSAVGLVRRPSAGREVAIGTAAGWAIGVALVMPGVLAMRMHSTLAFDGFHLGAATASVLVLLLFVLARQLMLCGLPFRSLSQATSPLFASVAFAGLAALLTVYTVQADATEAMLAALAQLVFGMAAVRTRAIWLGGMLQFMWGLTVTLLFGLPSFLWPPATGIVQSSMSGPRWLTGSAFGPEASFWAGLVVLAALIVVWRLTREYAWHYTFDPIVGAGYAMDVPPPAEHVRMEQSAQTAPLVQIGGAGAAAAGSVPDPSEPAERF
ncbi:hypothetical protein [Terriglobus sp.]|uniref:hypothetical protein n=1 Tax=Terriglobus sp. TaxID=1889013 RepID=UPI003B00F8C6